ncbi:MAG: hypothetical protein PHU37_09580 [Methanoculleus chikugoensis]|nr:hypothetical protein [Methanoculleus chikugoensis]
MSAKNETQEESLCSQYLSQDRLDERREIAAQLWKKDITVGEYIEKVFPEIFEKMPERSKEAYYSQKINWPDLTQYCNSTPGVYTMDGKLLDNSSEVGTLRAAILPWAESAISANSRNVYHRSESWIAFPPYLPVPYMGVASYLIRLEGTNEILVDTTVNAGYNIYNIKAENTPLVSTSGTYITEGLHVFLLPPDPCCPSEEISFYTLSDEIGVS